MELKNLIKKILRYNKNAKIELINTAYNYADKILNKEERKSKEQSIIHCLKVADEVANLKLDDNTIIASLLHTIIKKGADKKEIKFIFGDEVIHLLENLDKMSQIKKNIAGKINGSENLRKVLLAASKDIRVLLIKLCDKLVNLRDLNFLTQEEINRIAKESMELYAPLAYRLGIGKIKSELEDLSFKYLDQKKYEETEEKVNQIRKHGEKAIFKLKNILEKELKKEQISADVQARVKHIYSIYKKIISKSYDINDMSDIIGIRIIVDTIDNCYKTLRIVHLNFRPIPQKFKDYIAIPKPNGYQSLHTAVVDNEGKIFEVQIRTLEMHQIAEEGIAAHFTYKGLQRENEKFDRKIAWLKELVGSKNNSNIGLEFFSDQIFVFSPKGKLVELTSNATPLDFAYHIHTSIGNKCIGAKVNGKLVPLKTELENGDIIEIVTSKTQKPSRDWLKIVKTTRARDAIRHELKEKGQITSSVYSTSEEKVTLEEGLISIENIKNSKIKFAMCCNPLPGDEIAGMKTGMNKITIHKIICNNVQKNNTIKCKWLNINDKIIGLSINAEDRPGLFAEILNSVASFGLNVENAKGKTLGNNAAECTFKIKIKDLEQLKNIVFRIKKIKNVKNVYLTEI
ncbi:bifunctional (p)ppGpp synthetase/guanosine-3',5'-bis(diphosphate) 3'-pyrophosphohydrolase [Candidatus Woesearchaeota archaeon]|nr:bifunctional (p)ppGpp synthetase/guanosine-3',5'-bis(diphosphate) 3'-pyrophosphohydrolase [Candidatus Woesearchaeota archaeon]